MPTSGRFWPTPTANEMRTTDAERLLARRAACKAKHGNGNGFGLTLGNAITLEEAGLTSSPEDFRASPGPSRENSAAAETTAISGRNCVGLWPPSGPVGACWRTLLASSRWRTAYAGYTLTWKRSATRWGAELFRLRLSVPRTGATGSGSSRLWMTPKAASAAFGTPSTSDRPRAMSTHLGTQVQFWPTPNSAKAGSDLTLTCSGDGWEAPNKLGWAVAREMWPMPRTEGFDAGRHRGTADSLPSAVKLLPTPRAIYGEHPGMTDPSHLTGAAMLPTPTVQDGENTAGPSQFCRNSPPLNAVASGGTPGLKLSAAWVTRLMGYPDFWMDGLPD